MEDDSMGGRIITDVLSMMKVFLSEIYPASGGRHGLRRDQS